VQHAGFSNWGSRCTVEIIDLAVLRNRRLVDQPRAAAFTPGNAHVMVTDEPRRHLFLFHDSDLGTASKLKVGDFPAGIAINPEQATLQG